MNIDIEPLRNFEAAFSRVMDALEALKGLEPPVESEGAMGIAKWHREFAQTLRMLPTDIDATHLSRFAEEVEAALAKVNEAGQGAVAPRPSLEEQRMLPTPRGFWAEIVSETGSGAYTFKEKRLTDGTTWADLTGGRTGTVYEINDVTGVAVGTPIRVMVEHDTGGNLRYVFEAAVFVAGTADYDILYWNNTDKEWKLLAANAADNYALVTLSGVLQWVELKAFVCPE